MARALVVTLGLPDIGGGGLVTILVCGKHIYIISLTFLEEQSLATNLKSPMHYYLLNGQPTNLNTYIVPLSIRYAACSVFSPEI
jgi:hypothetical protein